jgi:galactokinase
VDLAGKKDTVKILSDLQTAYLSHKPLQAAMGEDNERFIRAAYRALGSGDAQELGSLMTQAQRNFDKNVAPQCPQELASPLLHELLACGDLEPFIYGGKGVGSQGDGTAQFVARSEADRESAMDVIARKFPQMRSFPLTIVPGRQGKS